jgi:CheY-like chemotaxis protein
MIMPDTDAISLLQRLREEACTAPFVVLTGMSREACPHADTADFAAYLIKPVDEETLVSTVGRLAVENVRRHAA